MKAADCGGGRKVGAPMRWIEVREQFPHQWLVVEAVDAKSAAGKRQVEELSVVNSAPTGEAALRTYLRLHRLAPERELYVLHTDREELDISERSWQGLRAAG
jgi:hypothetical protein